MAEPQIHFDFDSPKILSFARVWIDDLKRREAFPYYDPFSGRKIKKIIVKIENLLFNINNGDLLEAEFYARLKSGTFHSSFMNHNGGIYSAEDWYNDHST